MIDWLGARRDNSNRQRQRSNTTLTSITLLALSLLSLSRATPSRRPPCCCYDCRRARIVAPPIQRLPNRPRAVRDRYSQAQGSPPRNFRLVRFRPKLDQSKALLAARPFRPSVTSQTPQLCCNHEKSTRARAKSAIVLPICGRERQRS